MLPQKSPGYTNITDYSPLKTKINYSRWVSTAIVQAEHTPWPGDLRLKSSSTTSTNWRTTMLLRVSDSLGPLFLAEVVTERGSTGSYNMTKELREAAKSLKQKKDIIIHQASKTATFVSISADEYRGKLSSILNDASKFVRIIRNPVEKIKRKLNGIIEWANATRGLSIFPWYVGSWFQLHLRHCKDPQKGQSTPPHHLPDSLVSVCSRQGTQPHPDVCCTIKI